MRVLLYAIVTLVGLACTRSPNPDQRELEDAAAAATVAEESGYSRDGGSSQSSPSEEDGPQ